MPEKLVITFPTILITILRLKIFAGFLNLSCKTSFMKTCNIIKQQKGKNNFQMFKYIIFSLSLLFLFACEQNSKNGEGNNNQDTTIGYNGHSERPDTKENNSNLQTYTNNKFNFKLQYPSGWRIIENNIGGNFPVINLYPSQYGARPDQYPIH